MKYSSRLGQRQDREAFDPAPMAVIHCAWDRTARTYDEAERINVRGSLQLKALCKQKGVQQFIFISSMAAHAGARSVYGRAKFAVEQALDPSTSCIMKPGVIIGNGGLFFNTLRLAKRFPVLPVFFGDAMLQTIFIDDMCQAIFNAVERRVHGIFSIAHETPVPVKIFSTRVMQHAGRKVRLVSLPGTSALLVSRVFEALRLPLPITSDNLLGLKYGIHFETHKDCQTLGIEPLSFEKSLVRVFLP